MTGRMTVIAVRATGHVLGAVTEVAAGATPTVAAVAGDRMPSRFGTVTFFVPGSDLAVADLGFDSRVFEAPHDARVLFPAGSDQSASLSLAWSGITPSVQTPVPSDRLTVVVGSALPEDTAFWVLFQGPPDETPRVVTGVIAKGKADSGGITHGLTSGQTYAALVLLAGAAPVAQAPMSVP